jgi:glycosyltransferase involved in cell wall biosynthesis
VPKVLVISGHRLNRSPSQRYRYEQYISYLEQNGYEFTFSPILSEKSDHIFYSRGNFIPKAFIVLNSVFIRIKDALRCDKFDIVFIQREALFLGNTFFEKHAYKSKAKVIFDFDDSIWLMDTSPGNKKWEWLKDPNKTKSNIMHAHLVIAGNTYLADFAKGYNGNTILIPTTVDTETYKPKPELRNSSSIVSGTKVVIGWSGSLSTLKHFEMAIPVLQKLKEKYNGKIAFKYIGDSNYKNEELEIVETKWTPQNEIEELNKFDIGIMPLPDDQWAKGKCGLKGLTYMSCGIPTVMSSVGVNKQIITHGENGFLASTDEEWINYLSQLIESSELRNKIGVAGRETVVKTYSVQANKEKYLEAFKSLVR